MTKFGVLSAGFFWGLAVAQNLPKFVKAKFGQAVVGGLALLVLVYAGPAWSQAKLGTDINGEASYDKSGYSVSLSSNGTRVAIGARANDGNGNASGHVRVYEWNDASSAWTQVGSDIDGEAANDESGRSVSLSGDGTRVAIGATANNSYVGHVRVYELIGSNWIQLGADIDGEASSDQSGYSVSLSGDGTRVAIGALLNDGNGNDSGHVRVYQWDGVSSSWTIVGGDIDGEAANDRSGTTVSLSGDGTRVAIGAPYNSGNGTNSGHVRVYELSGNNWTQLVSDINGEAASDLSSESVSLSSDGTRVAIGSIYNDGNGSDSGHVRVYLNASRPSAPSAPTATSGNGQATVTWSKPADGGSTITGYTVTSAPDGQTCSTNDADTLSCVVTGLTNGTAYTFTVTATNDVGTSTSSSASNSVTPATELLPPTTPQILSVEASDEEITISVAAAVGATSYLATCSGSNGTFVARSSTTTIVVNVPSNGVTYVCSVVAENSIGSSEPSTEVSVTPEMAPSGLPIWLLYQATQ